MLTTDGENCKISSWCPAGWVSRRMALLAGRDAAGQWMKQFGRRFPSVEIVRDCGYTSCFLFSEDVQLQASCCLIFNWTPLWVFMMPSETPIWGGIWLRPPWFVNGWRELDFCFRFEERKHCPLSRWRDSARGIAKPCKDCCCCCCCVFFYLYWWGMYLWGLFKALFMMI